MAVAGFFLVLTLVMICVCSSKDPRVYIQNGYEYYIRAVALFTISIEVLSNSIAVAQLYCKHTEHFDYTPQEIYIIHILSAIRTKSPHIGTVDHYTPLM